MGLTVEKMLELSENEASAYNKFILEYKHNTNTIYYFIEGYDSCYYNNRIKKFANTENLKKYICGGKKNVISAREMIAKEKIKIDEKSKLMFFVDKDYGFDSIPEDVCTTEWYSIENFYLTKELIKKVLENFFELNSNESNYIKAMEYFEKTYTEYGKFARKLNIFFYTVRECEINQRTKKTDFNKILFYKFLENNKLSEFKMKEYSYLQLAQIYNIHCELNEELLNKNEYIFSVNDHSNFRGKSELEFLKYFLTSIRKSMENGTEGFEKKEVCRYDFNMDTMRILSEYAYTPKSLIKYLKTEVKSDEKILL